MSPRHKKLNITCSTISPFIIFKIFCPFLVMALSHSFPYFMACSYLSESNEENVVGKECEMPTLLILLAKNKQKIFNAKW